ncbi:MAG: ABC transporter permease [Opitutales bacterium]
MPSLWHDLRFALRLIRKTPWFSGLAVITLALGIGTVSGNLVILLNLTSGGLETGDGRPIYQGFHADDEKSGYGRPLKYQDFQYIQARQSVMTALGGYFVGTINVSDGRTPRRYQGTFMTEGVIDLLDVKPVHGRLFQPGDFEPDAPKALLITQAVFARDFQSDPLVLGRPHRINGNAGTIVGVLPDSFAFPVKEEAWLALQPRDAVRMVNLVGAVRPGIATGVAEEALTRLAVAHRKAEDGPPEEPPRIVLSGVNFDQLPDDFFTVNLTLMVVAMAVLFIACANVANLMLARSSARVRELGIRVALGASRRRIVSGVLLESLILSVLGLVLGVIHQMWELDGVEERFHALGLPYWIDFNYSPAAFGLSVLISILAALCAGILPALRASRIEVLAVLKDDSRTSSGLYLGRLSRWLVILQIAVSCALLILAGLMVTHLRDLMNQRMPFETDDVLTARFGLFEGAYPTDADINTFADRLLKQVTRQPEVAAAALTTRFRALESGWMDVTPRTSPAAEAPVNPTSVRYDAVSPGFPDVFKIPILAGRRFNKNDDRNSRKVVIIDRILAEELFPGEDPLGRYLNIQQGEQGRVDAAIVGLCGPAFAGDLSEVESGPVGGLLIPFAQQPKRFATLTALSASGTPDALLPVFRRCIRAVDPDLPLYFAMTPRESIRQVFEGLEVAGVFLLTIGGIALFLASVGLYGLMAHTVNLRRQEIGIRLALGADSPTIFAMIIRHGLGQVAIGLALGLILAVGLAHATRVLSPVLIGPVFDSAIFGGVLVLLSLSALAACLLPARRASREIHPLQALRYE